MTLGDMIMNNVLLMTCVSIEDRDGYFMVNLQIVSKEGNNLDTYAYGMISFTVANERANDFTVGSLYDLNLKEIK
jgi:hypothetical protein